MGVVEYHLWYTGACSCRSTMLALDYHCCMVARKQSNEAWEVSRLDGILLNYYSLGRLISLPNLIGYCSISLAGVALGLPHSIYISEVQANHRADIEDLSCMSIHHQCSLCPDVSMWSEFTTVVSSRWRGFTQEKLSSWYPSMAEMPLLMVK